MARGVYVNSYKNNNLLNKKTTTSNRTFHQSGRTQKNLQFVDFNKKLHNDKKKNKKNNNIFLDFYSFIISFCFILLFLLYVVPYSFKSITKPIFLSIFSQPLSVDYYDIYYPTLHYLHNNYFLDQHLFLPKASKQAKMSPLYLSQEMLSLKSQLNNVIAQYPQLDASVFVWDFQNSKYVDINGDKIYPTASIIKLPILIQLFKSIEMGQVSLNDKMALTDYYRAEGSGSLQFQKSDREYTLDYLARIMITESDNSATNMIMSNIGGKLDINRAVRQWGLQKTYVHNWLPDLGGQNVSTTKELATILFNIDNASFLSLNSHEKIIDYMSHVKNNRLIAAGLGPNALIAHKTGDIGSCLGDAGIVYLPDGRRYIIAMMVKRPHNSFAAKELIIQSSKIVYNFMINS